MGARVRTDLIGGIPGCDHEVVTDEEDEPGELPAVARESTAGLAAAGLGAAAAMVGGGPLGVVVAAGAGPWLSMLLRSLTLRGNRLLGPALEAAGGAEELSDRFADDERLVAAVIRAGDVAASTALTEHIDAMAAVLRDRVRADLSPSETERLLDAIALMNADAVLVLDHIVTHSGREPSTAENELAEQLELSLSAARVALRRLEEGEVVATGGGTYGGGEAYHPTELASQVLAYLREAGAVDST